HGAVHLADRRGRQRLFLELQEESLEWLAEGPRDHALDVFERERRDRVLQAAQLGDDVGRHDVGPRREQLAELDERRAELVEHLAGMPPPGRRASAFVALTSVDEVAEAVPGGDMGDLADATDRKRRR